MKKNTSIEKITHRKRVSKHLNKKRIARSILSIALATILACGAVPGFALGADVTEEAIQNPITVDSDSVTNEQPPAADEEPADTPLIPAPKEQTTIKDLEPPLSFGGTESWALLNLLLTIITGILMLLLAATYFMHRRRDGNAEEYSVKRHGAYRIVSIVATAVAIAIFVITENMSLPMQFVDSYTLGHVLIAIVQAGIAILARKKYELSKETEQ